MRRVLTLVFVFCSSFSGPVSADVLRLDWNLSSISFGDIAGASYDVLKLDIDTGSVNSRYFSVGGALLASASSGVPVFPVTGTCLGLADSNIRCALHLERGTLVIDVNSSLSGNFAVVDQSGVAMQSGSVIYTGIVQ